MAVDPLDFSLPGWELKDGRWQNPSLEKRAREEKEAERVAAEQTKQEQAVLPRLQRLEASRAEHWEVLRHLVDKLGEVFEFANEMDDKNVLRNQRIDALEASTRQLENGSGSAERLGDAFIQIAELKASVAEHQRRLDSYRRHIDNLENKVKRLRDGEPVND